MCNLIDSLAEGDSAAELALSEELYNSLHAVAAKLMNGERAGHSLQATILVHDAYLKLIGQRNLDFRQRSYVLAAAARTMRRLLIDHARGRNRLKRGGQNQQVSLQLSAVDVAKTFDTVALDDALQELASVSEDAAAVVELKFFGGLKHEEIAAALDCSPRTVSEKWRFAKAWLYRELDNAS